jgi:hypothetical protein
MLKYPSPLPAWFLNRPVQPLMSGCNRYWSGHPARTVIQPFFQIRPRPAKVSVLTIFKFKAIVRNLIS